MSNTTETDEAAEHAAIVRGLVNFMAWGLFLIGAALLVAGFMMDASVEVSSPSYLPGVGSGLPTRIVNNGLLNTKLMLSIAGGCTMICGAIFATRRP